MTSCVWLLSLSVRTSPLFTAECYSVTGMDRKLSTHSSTDGPGTSHLLAVSVDAAANICVHISAGTYRIFSFHFAAGPYGNA